MGDADGATLGVGVGVAALDGAGYGSGELLASGASVSVTVMVWPLTSGVNVAHPCPQQVGGAAVVCMVSVTDVR